MHPNHAPTVATDLPVRLRGPELDEIRYRAVLLIGPPGSGKGTQGRTLGALPGFYHCACGDVLRSVDPESDRGRAFRGYSDRGELVPDELTVAVWRDHMRSLEREGRFRPDRDVVILDGIPRTLGQAVMLGERVEVLCVLHLRCADPESLIERMRHRAGLEGRADDSSEEVVRRRLEVYRRQTDVLLAHYGPDLVADINAGLPPMNVLSEVLAAVLPRTASLGAIGT